MLLLLLILASAALGVFGSWFAVALISTDGSGNPALSALVAMVIVLFWAYGGQRISGAYVAGRFDLVRRQLGIWQFVMGMVETLIVRLWMDVETRDAAAIERDIENCRAVGLEIFARAWSAAHGARLSGNSAKAKIYFLAGARKTQGLDRSELLTEAALLTLQECSAFGMHPDARQRAITEAVGLLNEADSVLRDAGGDVPRQRAEYIDLFHQGVRALVFLAQDRPADADERLETVIRRASERPDLRTRRFSRLMTIESLRIMRALEGDAVFDLAIAAEWTVTALPGLRLRLEEIAAAARAARDARRQEAQAQGSSATTGTPQADVEERIALDGSIVRSAPTPLGSGMVAPPPHRPAPVRDLPAFRSDDDEAAGPILTPSPTPAPVPVIRDVPRLRDDDDESVGA